MTKAGRPTTRALARTITRLENGQLSLSAALAGLGLVSRESRVIGVTGPPGSGKSTLVDKLTRLARAAGQSVAIVAVDPSSPFSGGALLGDRVRMLAHSGDPDVFIRSMAARRALGGLSAATRDAAALLAASGFDLILIETVGVGQSELDILQAAESVVVVLVPGLGDSVQTLKAGLMEIADLFVVNMADRPGVDRTVSELRAMQTLGPLDHAWPVPVIETIATRNQGVDELWAALEAHRRYLESSGELETRRRRRIRAAVLELVERELELRLAATLRSGPAASALKAALEQRIDTRAAAAAILDELIRTPS